LGLLNPQTLEGFNEDPFTFCTIFAEYPGDSSDVLVLA
jgi:hypothetical protein